MRLILLGAPGSGKGSIAAELREMLGIAHVSTGDIFRQNIKDSTELGEMAASYIQKGELVPDDVTIRMVARRLEEKDCDKGFMLDGFPRTIPQANALAGILSSMSVRLNAVINVVLDEEIIIRRLTNRRVCTNCGRSYNLVSVPPARAGICDACGGTVEQREDDQPETIRQRLITYHEQTSPLIEYYRQQGIVVDITNEGTTQEAIVQVRKRLNL